MPTIGRPFPGIAQHPDQTEAVGREGIHRSQQPVVPRTATAIAVGMARADVLSPPAGGGGAGAGGIFPFRFAGQAIGIAVADLGMGGARLLVDPGDEGFGVLPVQAHRRPLRRLDIGGRGGQTALVLLPAQHQQRIAGLRLIAGGGEKSEKLLAGDRILAEGKGPDGHRMLRAFGIEPARLMRWAAHQEFASRDTHHLQAFRTFLEFTVRRFLVGQGQIVGGLAAEKDGECQGGGKTKLHGAIKAGTGSRANRFGFNVRLKENP
jgi:hypothetical protein